MAQLDMSTDELYDLIVIGGGPAAINAALYALRKGMKTAIICKDFGGHVKDTVNIENYLGFMKIDGYDLMDKFKEQIMQFDCYVKQFTEVISISDGYNKTVVTDDNLEYKTKTLILATGSKHRILGVPGEKELFGMGLSYCAICDGPLFRGRDVIIVGGGNSAVSAAIDLAKICRKITLVHRSAFRADHVLLERMDSFSNIEILLEHQILEVLGTENVEGVKALDKKNSKEKIINADALFIEIGLVPNSLFAKGTVDINDSGEIVTDRICQTSAEGIFAAGDVSTSPYKQIVIASAEGAIAALSANDYINRKRKG